MGTHPAQPTQPPDDLDHRAVILSVSLLEIGIFGRCIVRELILGELWEKDAAAARVLLISGSFAIMLCVGIVVLFYIMKLVTEVRSDGLYIRFYPLHRSFHKIPLENLKECEARTYRPLREYHGWGVRYVRKGKVYNVSGNLGVRLDYSNGRHLLIGSQKAEELAQAIKSVLGKARMTEFAGLAQGAND